ncbi:MAG: DMT family transporter [Caldilineaceae bacterium]|nr:DMT family transporter [Caldilineaceae bacterium]
MRTATQRTSRTNVAGIGFLVLAMFVLSLQDVAIKWINGSYPVLEITILRNLAALPCTLILFRMEGGRGLPTTQRYTLEYARGLLLFLSFTTYMMGLAALPLADVSAIRNSAPLLITFLSVVLLGEHVGSRRWLALIIGFMGVLLIIQPGGATFNMGSIFVLLATLFYALNIIITRQLRTTDSSATMAYYSTLVYLAAALILTPFVLFVGEIPNAHPSIVFLFRAWAMPTLTDWLIMVGLGFIWAIGMYLIARAYSLAQASAAAPFEYVALLFSVFWGFTIWGEIPTWATWIGATITVLSGLYILYRERAEPPST